MSIYLSYPEWPELHLVACPYYLSIFLTLAIHISSYLAIHLSILLSVCQPVISRITTASSISPFMSLFSIHLSILIYIFLSSYPFVYLSICLSTCHIQNNCSFIQKPIHVHITSNLTCKIFKSKNREYFFVVVELKINK